MRADTTGFLDSDRNGTAREHISDRLSRHSAAARKRNLDDDGNVPTFLSNLQ
jgi:hypothetical protein